MTTRTDDELKALVQAYVDAGGNRSEAARRLGMPRMSFNDALKEAETQLGIRIGRVADGRIEEVAHDVWPLPAPGRVQRYIFTSAQNNTYLHPGWINLKAYSDWLDNLPEADCRFVVGTFSYAIDAYGAKAVKRGAWKPDDDLWYAPEVQEFFVDARVELAPGLVWCGEMNILPTTRYPLAGLETYNGRKSNIVPHAKIAMESVPSMPDEGTKFNWSTGAITQRNYIQKAAGIKAEPGHSYGGTLVEISADGNWWVRQLHIDGNGHVYDVGPDTGREGKGAVRVVDGIVYQDADVDSITWGDIHTAEMDDWVAELGWGITAEEGNLARSCMLDELRPKRQVMHDIYSHRSRSHHEMKSFHSMYRKMVTGQDSVEEEVAECAWFLRQSHRSWCQTIVVPSNHDRHLTRWLNDEDPRKDPKNARYHMQLQTALLDAIERRDRRFNVLEYALRQKSVPEDILFLDEDQSYVICRDVDGGIEIGLHGDLGPNGSRGSTRGLTKLGRAVNKGHDHTAAIRENVYSVGACSTDFSYMAGPSSHSVSHIVTFPNGRRQIITMWEGRWRA